MIPAQSGTDVCQTTAAVKKRMRTAPGIVIAQLANNVTRAVDRGGIASCEPSWSTQRLERTVGPDERIYLEESRTKRRTDHLAAVVDAKSLRTLESGGGA